LNRDTSQLWFQPTPGSGDWYQVLAPVNNPVFNYVIDTSWVNASSAAYSHGFPYPPDVWVLDENNTRVWVTVQHPYPNQIYIEFPQPFTGRILLQ